MSVQNSGPGSYQDLEVQNVWHQHYYRFEAGSNESFEQLLEVEPLDGNLQRDEIAELVAMDIALEASQNDVDSHNSSSVMAFFAQFGANLSATQTPDYERQDVDVDDDGTFEYRKNETTDDDSNLWYHTVGHVYPAMYNSTSGLAWNGTVFFDRDQMGFRHLFGGGPLIDRSDEVNSYIGTNAKGVETDVEINLRGNLYWDVHDYDVIVG